MCDTSHAGISISKLMHAVVTFKDIHYGPGNWSWNNAPVIPDQQLQ